MQGTGEVRLSNAGRLGLCLAAITLASPTLADGPWEPRVAVTSGPRIAAAIEWPPPQSLAAEGAPASAIVEAARAALARSTPHGGNPEPLWIDDGGLLVAGFAVDAGSDEALAAAIARLARPAAGPLSESGPARVPVPEEVAALRAVEADVLDLLAGIGPERGTTRSRAATASELRRAGELLEKAPRRVLVAGPAGLAPRILATLGRSPGATPAVETSSEGVRGRVTPADSVTTAVAIGYAIDARAADELGSSLPVVAEVLREGPGSLRQRLSVAVGESVRTEVALRPLGGGRAALVLAAEVPAESSATAWRVLEGTASSSTALPPREASLVEARRRLDRRADRLATDAAGTIRGPLLGPHSWRWPPADRWSSPLRPARFLEVARSVLSDARRAVAARGRIPAALARERAFAAVLDGSGAGPDGLAARVAAAIEAGGLRAAPVAYRGRYRVDESTPLGTVTGRLTIEGRGSDVDLSLVTPTRRAGSALATSRAGATREEDTTLAARRVAAALRQPAVLLGLARAGAFALEERDVTCEDGTCPALTGELRDGTRFALLVDEESWMPRELRLRWCCGEFAEPADERVRYLDWTEVAGVRLASRMQDVGLDGARRSVRLETWRWLTARADDTR